MSEVGAEGNLIWNCFAQSEYTLTESPTCVRVLLPQRCAHSLSLLAPPRIRKDPPIEAAERNETSVDGQGSVFLQEASA